MTTSKLPLVDHQHDALQIIHLLGGQKNIKQIFSCMTRLRILVYNDNLIDKQQLANYGKLINSGHQLQIFMGSGIAQIYEQAVNHNLNSLSSNTQAENNSSMEPTQSVSDNTDNWQTNKANSKAKYNLRISHILSKFGNIFVPLLPALIAAGLVGGIANFIQNYHTAHHLTLPIYYHVLKLVNNAFFAYFLIFVGINAAKEFGASSTLGGMVAGICLMPGLSPEIKQILNVHASSGGVFGLLFACWLLAYLEKYLNKIVPASLQILFTPPIAMIIIALFLILAIIPLDNILTSYMVLGIDKLLQGAPILAGYILASAFLPLVMLGLHQGILPIHLNQLAATGSATLFPILAMAGAGQVGAALALLLRIKDTSIRSTIKSALPIGFMGIGEPLIYGVTLPLGKPFLTSCLGSGFGGMYIAYMKVGVLAIGPSGLALLPLVNHGGILNYLIGLALSILGGFIITLFWGIPKNIN